MVAVAEDLRVAATAYARDGWATHPLTFNDEGFAKVAMVSRWQTLGPSDFENLPWDDAAGIGILGGANSSNLGFIDIDDQELARDTAAWYLRQHVYPRFAWTARGRIHVYVIEPEPSRSRKLDLKYKGRRVLVELRATGAYVAAPPTPGYKWANEAWEPLYDTLTGAWTKVASALGVEFYSADRNNSGALAGTSAGYPKSWAKSISHGERNDACFYESSCLKDAHVPMEQAWAIMQARINQSYTPPLDWRELRRTFESAYRRPVSSRDSTPDRGVVERFAR